MKSRRFIIMLTVTLMLCGAFGILLRIYWEPMNDQIYDLSLGWDSETMPDDWVYDQKGWRVYVQEGDTARELEPDSMGDFSGLSDPWQTFYMSRVMEEDLGSPTLRLGTASRTFSVFLDGTLIYTDCPELDNRIGFLELPCLDYYREEPLLVPLPLDYAGKTLTIAQSTDPETESDLTVTPCAVTLYCGYTYESEIISESFQVAVPSALAFAAGAALFLLSLWRAARGKLDATLICGAMAMFLYESSQMFSTAFFHFYFEPLPIDIPVLCRKLALLNLLGLLLCKMTGRRRIFLWGALGGMGGAMLAESFLPLSGRSANYLTDSVFACLGIGGLLIALTFGFWELKRSRFFQIFCPLAAAWTALVILCAIVSGISSGNMWEEMGLQARMGAFGYFLWPLMLPFMGSAFLGAVVEMVQDELSARAEAKLVARQTQMAQQSYDTMHRQHQEVMLLRHDMMKHYGLLRQMSKEHEITEYLDELIGESKAIRPVI